MKPGVIESFVPIFIFTILFGLSMDYHVFILTRIKEARDRGLPSDAAVERGISITAGTITSAAAIMVAVFAVFVTLRLNIIRQLGFGLAVAVFLDATVIRSVLLPASMRLLGRLELVDAAVPVVDPAGDDRGRIGRTRGSDCGGVGGPARAGPGACGRFRLGTEAGREFGLEDQPGMRMSTQTRRWSDDGTGKPAPVSRTSGSGGKGQNTAASTILSDLRGST